MKILITILLFPLFSHAQQWYVPTSNDAVITGLSFIAGGANGLEETIKFHYASFKKVHPNGNDEFWNPAISWTNKNKNWFTKLLPTFTDGYHLSRGTARITAVGTIAISLIE